MGEFVKRAIKYLVEGLMIAIACFILPKSPMKADEIALIALTGAATFLILDTRVPSVAGSARMVLASALAATLLVSSLDDL